MRGSSTRGSILAKHRREMQRQVYLPLAVTGLLLIIVSLAVVIGMSSYQVGTVSAFMSLLLLVPAVLVCLIPYVALVALAAGLFKFNRWLPARFITVRSAALRMSLETRRLTQQVARPIIWLNGRFAWLERFLKVRSPRALPMLPRSVEPNEQ